MLELFLQYKDVCNHYRVHCPDDALETRESFRHSEHIGILEFNVFNETLEDSQQVCVITKKSLRYYFLILVGCESCSPRL